MSTPFTHTRYVRRGDSPWGLGIPADAVLIHQDIHGRQYGWREAPVIPPSQAELDKMRDDMENRRQTIERFLISTFDITEEEQQFVKEVLAGKDITTIEVSGRGHGKTRRAWAWERLMKRLHDDSLPSWFWPNVHAYRMLTDSLGRDIIHTLTKDRA